jgi:hypothetical protein
LLALVKEFFCRKKLANQRTISAESQSDPTFPARQRLNNLTPSDAEHTRQISPLNNLLSFSSLSKFNTCPHFSHTHIRQPPLPPTPPPPRSRPSRRRTRYGDGSAPPRARARLTIAVLVCGRRRAAPPPHAPDLHRLPRGARHLWAHPSSQRQVRGSCLLRNSLGCFDSPWRDVSRRLF